MEPFEAYWRLRLAIPKRPELRHSDWPNSPQFNFYFLGPYRGACHIATEVFCHLVEGSEAWVCTKPVHYWSVFSDKIWDATADQFDSVFDYSKGLQIVNPKLSQRSEELLAECLSIDNIEQHLLLNIQDRQLKLL